MGLSKSSIQDILVKVIHSGYFAPYSNPPNYWGCVSHLVDYPDVFAAKDFVVAVTGSQWGSFWTIVAYCWRLPI